MAGKSGATDEEVLNAARLARCDDIIAKYGMDYYLGGGGNTLSGGEKQRINIARAILKNAPILLLDEVSSALDAENEKLLNQALTELKKNKTIIMVAHKLNSVTDADGIIMIDDGKILARGTHESLLRDSEAYRNLWDMYVSADKWQFNVGEIEQ
ncbi:ATP-binding cassette domain-containing protein [uncultured Ruminobacter sp.]|uniref:ATP-binding cassette domain-containing protein n=1 Tax=uncultured Ruminobacter sp. TaxID=538947 RepID=UPI0025D48CC6|nr:ATP-binding cassette domain-containing protein [uncultured Ruminobacter sp.]